MRRVTNGLILLALAMLVVICCSACWQDEPPRYEHKAVRKFDPCRFGGKNVKSYGSLRVIAENWTSGAIKFPDGACQSVVVASADFRPTVMVCSVSCSVGGPFYRVLQIVNPDQPQVWLTPCRYLQFSVDTHVVGTVSWQPQIGDKWAKTEENGWYWE